MQQTLSRARLEQELHEVHQSLAVEISIMIKVQEEPSLFNPRPIIIRDIDYDVRKFQQIEQEQREQLLLKKKALVRQLQLLPEPMDIEQ